MIKHHIAKIELLMEMDNKFTERLSTITKMSMKTVQKNVANWISGKNISEKSILVILNSANQWLRETSQNKPQLEYRDLCDSSPSEFYGKIINQANPKSLATLEKTAAQDPRFNIEPNTLDQTFQNYNGFFVAWIHWIDTNGKPTIYQFMIRIGNQKVLMDKVIIDFESSINYTHGTINAYLTTAKHWSTWKSTLGSNAYNEAYRDYGWWGGEMIPLVASNDIIWFRFWNDKEGTTGKYHIMAAQDRRGKVNVEKEGIEAVCMAQPSYSDRRKSLARPTCSKAFMKYIGSELPIIGDFCITYWLDNMRHIDPDSSELDEEIRIKVANTISSSGLLQS